MEEYYLAVLLELVLYSTIFIWTNFDNEFIKDVTDLFLKSTDKQ